MALPDIPQDIFPEDHPMNERPDPGFDYDEDFEGEEE